MRALFSACVAVVFGLYAPLAFCAGEGAPAIEVDLYFVSGPDGLPPSNDNDGTQTKSLNKDGFAVFTQATPLPNSDLYTGYWLVVTKSAQSKGPFPESFSVQIYYNQFRGFLALEPDKYTPILTLIETASELARTDQWQEVYLRDPLSNESKILAIAYLRLRTGADATERTPKPARFETLPEAEK